MHNHPMTQQLVQLDEELLDQIAGGAGGTIDPNGTPDAGGGIDPDG